MKKIAVLILLALPLIGYSQGREGKKFHFEFGPSFNLPLSKNGALNTKGAWGGYVEGRFAVKESPLRLGFNLSVTTMKKDYNFMNIGIAHLDFNSLHVMAVGDYSFFRDRKISPFVGTSLGISFGNIGTGIFNKGFTTRFCFAPRVGVRLFKRISVGVDMVIVNKDHSTASMRLGYYF